MRDVVIGMSDGLTVPFALAAGLSGAVSQVRVIVIAGLAEIAAGSIAMGLGGYLAAGTDSEHYAAERRIERAEVREDPAAEVREVVDIFGRYGVSDGVARAVAADLRRQPDAWLDFLMRFELGLERPDPRRALRSAATIAGSYVAGGAIPLSPYLLLGGVGHALAASVAVTVVALLAFGYVKGRMTGTAPLRGAVQTALVGGLAASSAFALARLISGARP